MAKQYKVFRHPSGALESVRPGWSWQAFCFGCFWALALKMWGLGVAGLVALGLIGWVVPAELLGAFIFALFMLGCHLVFGLRGPAWRIQHLLGQGYRHADTVTAADSATAMTLAAKYRGWNTRTETDELSSK